jgi:hypothetical protein
MLAKGSAGPPDCLATEHQQQSRFKSPDLAQEQIAGQFPRGAYASGDLSG